jgi:hypothetical protein
MEVSARVSAYFWETISTPVKSYEHMGLRVLISTEGKHVYEWQEYRDNPEFT